MATLPEEPVIETAESGTKKPRAPRKKKADSENKPAASLSRFQKFTMATIHRTKLKGAPYNPRAISDKARIRLKANLNRVGLLEPVIWNVRTGFVVGGHMRLACLDALEKSTNYLLEVAQVDLDSKTEKEQNVALNNLEMQGQFDLALLEPMLRGEDRIDFENAGFGADEIYRMFGNEPLIEEPEKMQAMADKIRAAHEVTKSIKSMRAGRDDQHFYIVAVFKNHDARKAFTDALGLDDRRYVDGAYLTAKLGAAGEGPDIAGDILG